jgi:hypothetical protein
VPSKNMPNLGTLVWKYSIWRPWKGLQVDNFFSWKRITDPFNTLCSYIFRKKLFNDFVHSRWMYFLINYRPIPWRDSISPPIAPVSLMVGGDDSTGIMMIYRTKIYRTKIYRTKIYQKTKKRRYIERRFIEYIDISKE